MSDRTDRLLANTINRISERVVLNEYNEYINEYNDFVRTVSADNYDADSLLDFISQRQQKAVEILRGIRFNKNLFSDVEGAESAIKSISSFYSSDDLKNTLYSKKYNGKTVSNVDDIINKRNYNGSVLDDKEYNWLVANRDTFMSKDELLSEIGTLEGNSQELKQNKWLNRFDYAGNLIGGAFAGDTSRMRAYDTAPETAEIENNARLKKLKELLAGKDDFDAESAYKKADEKNLWDVITTDYTYADYLNDKDSKNIYGNAVVRQRDEENFQIISDNSKEFDNDFVTVTNIILNKQTASAMTPDSSLLGGLFSNAYDDNLIMQTDPEIQKIIKKWSDKGYDFESLYNSYQKNANANYNEWLRTSTAEETQNNPVLSNIGSVFTNVAGGVAALPSVIETGLEDALSDDIVTLDTNAPEWALKNVTDSIRDTTSQMISEKNEGIKGEFFNFLYQTGISIADMGAATLVSGMNPTGMQIIMGTNAAADSIKTVTEKGGSIDEALLTGLTSGIFEALFEKVSIDNLFRTATSDTGKKLIYNFVKGFLSEGSEELCTEIANTFADALINGNNSEFNNSVYNYMADGKTAAEARSLAMVDTMKQMGLSFAGGALSGGLVSGVGGGINLMSANSQYSRAGNEIINNGNVDSVMQLADEIVKNQHNEDVAYDLGAIEKYQKGIENKAFRTSGKADINTAVENRLGELGVTDSKVANRVTDAFIKGTEYRKTGNATVDKYASRVLSELRSSENATGRENFTNEWASPVVDKARTDAKTAAADKYRARDIGRLAGNVQNAIINSTQENINAEIKKGIQTRVEYLGVDKSTSKTAADIVFKAFMGDKLTPGQHRILEKNQIVKRVYNELKAADEVGINDDNSWVSPVLENAGILRTVQNVKLSGITGSKENTVTGDGVIDNDSSIENELISTNSDNRSTPTVVNGTEAFDSFVENVRSESMTTGVVKKYSKTEIDNKTAGQIAVLDAYGRKHGLSFIVVDSIGEGDTRANGTYVGKNKVLISLDAEGGALLSVAGHEVYHYIARNNKLGADSIKAFVLDKLKNNANYDYEFEFNKLVKSYGTENVDEIEEEMVANAMFELLSDEDVINDLAKENPTLLEKIIAAIKDFIKELKKMAKKLPWAEVAVLQGDIQSLETIKAMAETALWNIKEINEHKRIVEQKIGASENTKVNKTRENVKTASAENSESEENVKKENNTVNDDGAVKFNFSSPVERTKELIAVHNMTVNELQKTLDLGGLPMPSIAIIKAERGHSEYGDVSIVFPKDVVDPKKSPYNKVYGGDAWTPTYPTIEFKVNEKVSDKISKIFYDVYQKYGSDEARPLYNYANDLERQLNNHNGEAGLIEWLKEDEGLMQLYLLYSERGKVEPVIKQTVTELSDAEVEMYDYLVAELGNNVITELKTPEGKKAIQYRNEYYSKYGEQIETVYKQLLKDLYNFSDEEIDNVINNMRKGDFITLIRKVYLYVQNGKTTVKEETDRTATSEAIQKTAKEAGFDEWVEDLFRGVEEKSGIRNNADLFTSTGNRRSWEALHWENNLENVVKVMKSQNNGVAAFFSGHGIWAVSAKDYKSIDEIKSDSDRLKTMPQEQYNVIKEEFGMRFNEIAMAVMDKSESNQFIATDNAMQCIIDAVRRSKTKSGILRELKQYRQLDVTETAVDDIVSLVSDIANMPTEYFEAKPQRAVMFDEIATIILPEGASLKLKQELSDREISYLEYEDGNEQDRLEKLNSLDAIKFSFATGNKVYETKNTATDDSAVEYSIRLSENDLNDYLNAGSRKNKNKISAIQNNHKILLTSEDEIVDFINDSINNQKTAITVAYGKVNDRLALDVYEYSNGSIDINNNYIELIPNNIHHAFEEHQKAKETGDIDLSEEDFEKIPEYLDTYDELVYAIKFASGNTRICVSKKLQNGRILIIETVSKSRGSIQFKNAIGVTEEKYINEYISKYKKGSGKNTRGNNSSNISLRDLTTSKNSLSQNDKTVNNQYMQNSKNDTIKLSLQETAQAGEVKEKLIQENDNLRVANTLLKKEMKLTRGRMLSLDNTRLIARQLTEQYSSDYDRELLARQIYNIFNHYDETGDYDYLMNYLATIGKRVVARSSAVDSSLYEDYEDCRKWVRNMEFTLPEQVLKQLNENYDGQFVKKTFGRMRYVSRATHPDAPFLSQIYSELANEYPNFFSIEDNEYEQPMRLIEFWEKIQPTVYNPVNEMGYATEDDAAVGFAFDVFNAYSKTDKLETFADKKKKEIENIRKEYDRNLERAKQKLNADRDRRLEWQKEYYINAREKSSEGRKKAYVKKKIRNVIKDLDKYLNRGSKDKNVKDDLQETVQTALTTAELLFSDIPSNEDIIRAGVTSFTKKEAQWLDEYDILLKKRDDYSRAYALLQEKELTEDVMRQRENLNSLIDNTNKRLRYLDKCLEDVFEREKRRLENATVGEALSKLAVTYAKIKDSEHSYISQSYDENVYDKINELVSGNNGSAKISLLTLNELDSIYEVYKMVLHTVRNANKIFTGEKKQTAEELGKIAMRQIREVGGNKKRRIQALDFLKRFGWSELKPVYAFRLIGSDVLQERYAAMRNGEDTYYRDVSHAKEFYAKLRDKYKTDEWKLDKGYEFVSKDGDKFTLTLEQIMSIYAYCRRGDQAVTHLTRGGFVFSDAITVEEKKKGQVIKYKVDDGAAYSLSPEVLGEINHVLDDNKRAFVEEMQTYLSDVMGDKGNEVSMKMYGVKLFKEKNYFPLKSSAFYRAFDGKVEGESSLKNAGFSKATTPKANNPIVLDNFLSVWSNHVQDMAMYHSFVLPIEDFTKVFNYESHGAEDSRSVSVKATLQGAYGPSAEQYVRNLLTDLNSGVRSQNGTEFVNKLTGLAKKGAVFASMSVVIQQPSAVVRATAHVNPKYFINAFPQSANWLKVSKEYEELKKYAPVAGIKEMGYFDTGLGKSTADWITEKEYRGFGKKFKAFVSKDGKYRDDVFSMLAGKADEVSWVYIWNAVKKEVAEKQHLSGEALLNAAGKRFTEVVELTQVYDSVFSRSGLMRSKDTGVKMVTAFMAEPTTQVNMLFDAAISGKRGNKKQAAAVIGSVYASILVNAILKSIVSSARDDDDEFSYSEKYISNIISSFISDGSIVSSIPFARDIISLIQGYDVERMDMTVIADIINSFRALQSDKKTTVEKISDIATSLLAVLGIPAKNILKDIKALYNTYNSIAADYEYSPGALKESIKRGITGKKTSKDDLLYNAIVSGDTEYAERLKAMYETESGYNTAIRAGLKKYDSRIYDAAVARMEGNTAEYMRLAKEIIAEGNFSQDDVVSAIKSTINSLTVDDNADNAAEDKAESIFTDSDYFDAIIGGDGKTADIVGKDLVDTDVANGKTQEDAEKSLVSSLRDNIRDAFDAGEIEYSEAKNILVKYCGMSETEADNKLKYWDFRTEYPDYDLAEETVIKYYKEIESGGISVDIYYEYYVNQKACKGIKDDNGKTISGSKKEQILKVIDALPLTSKQKDLLYFQNNWSESTLYQAPWH